MQSPFAQKTSRWWSVLYALPAIVLLIAMLVFFHNSFDTRLAYQHQSLQTPLFPLCLRDFRQSIHGPADIVGWVSRALSQAYFFEWLGPMVIVLVIAAIIAAVAGYARAVACRGVGGAWIIPAFALMALHNQYDYYMVSSIGLLAALAALNAYVWLPLRHAALRATAMAVLAAGLYFVAGPPCALLAAGAAIYEFFTARRWFPGVSCLLIPPLAAIGVEWLASDNCLLTAGPATSLMREYLTAAAPSLFLVAGALVYESLARAALGRYLRLTMIACLTVPAAGAAVFATAVLEPVWRVIGDRWTPAFWKYANTPLDWTLIALYAYVVVLGAGVGLWRALADAIHEASAARGKQVVLQSLEIAPPGAPTFPFFRIAVVPFLLTLAVLGGAQAIGPITTNGWLKAGARVEKLYEDEDWDEILQEARRTPKDQYSFGLNMAVNRALYHKGRLAYDMFSYPQQYKMVTGILDVPDQTGMCALSDLMLHLGRPNEAEGFAGVFDRADLVRRLAWIKLVKREPRAARPYLNVLADNVKYSAWARELLKRTDADPYLEGPAEVEIKRIRENIPPPDRENLNFLYVDYILRNPRVYLDPLRANAQNKMAFEYLMAFYLMERKLERVYEHLIDAPPIGFEPGRPSRLNSTYMVDGRPFTYPDIPRHYEEAMLMYEKGTGQALRVPGKTISPQTRARFEAFTARFAPYQKLWDQKDAAVKAANFKRKGLKVAHKANDTKREAELNAAIADDERRAAEATAGMEALKADLRPDFYDTYYFYFYFAEGGRP